MYHTQRNTTIYKQAIERLGGPDFMGAFANESKAALLMAMVGFPGVIRHLLPSPPTVFRAPNHEHRIKTLIDNLHANKRSTLRFHP